jgi:hypothetical protein
MRKLKLSAALLIALAAPLAGCVTTNPDGTTTNISAGQAFQNGLTKADVFANKYGRIVGKDIIMVANILVIAECSPALGATTSTITNVLSIVAPNSSSAQTVGNVLSTNYQVAQQLCPLISAIKTSVGNVPNGNPTQVVPATGS